MTFLWIFTVMLTFVFMEFVAWFSHKYIMHGFWSLHKDHHIKDHDSWFERNDFFFIFYALVSSVFVILWGEANFWFGFTNSFRNFSLQPHLFLWCMTFLFTSGLKIFRKANGKYAKGIRRAHKIHHKNIHKEDGECFGMLWVPLKYFK